jgi:proline dehydrogenase
VGIATHDDWLIDRALELIGSFELAKEQYEFQMLLGVRPELRRRLLASGHRLRVYVPYGLDWYGYSMRRMRENPQIARHVIKALVRKG